MAVAQAFPSLAPWGDVSAACAEAYLESDPVSSCKWMRPARLYRDAICYTGITTFPRSVRSCQLSGRMVSDSESSNLTALIYEHTCAALESALDLMGRPLFLFRADGKLLRMNSKARALVSYNDGLRVRNSHLEAGRPTETARIRESVRKTFTWDDKQHLSVPTFVAVNRPSGCRPFILWIAPIGSGIPQKDEERRRLAGIVVIDPDASPRNLDQVLREVLGLTSAEVRLANALLRGDDLTGAAERFGVSRNTVRSQLQSIFGKTGTSRQGELVRLLTQLTL